MKNGIFLGRVRLKRRCEICQNDGHLLRWRGCSPPAVCFLGVNQCRDFHVGGASCVEDMAKNVFWMFSGEFRGKQGQRGFAGKLLGVVYCSFFRILRSKWTLWWMSGWY